VVEKKVIEKMSYKEKLELETLNKNMPELEAKKNELTAKLNNPDLNYEEIISYSEKLAKINSELEIAELRWLALSEKG
jgi:ATP-binding cassette subfamily F protein uup